MKICVSSCCVAATLTEHGSAGRTPTSVEKMRDVKAPSPLTARSCFPICVSHSLATTKMAEVEETSRLEEASGANVPPECETTITMESVKSSLRLPRGCPMAGTGRSCPNRPRILLALTERTSRRGNALARSAANCSASHSETSHPVTTTSTERWLLVVPLTRRSSRRRKHRDRFQAVSRFREIVPFGLFRQSSWMSRRTRGTSRTSAPTRSGRSGASGLMNSLPSSRVMRWNSAFFEDAETGASSTRTSRGDAGAASTPSFATPSRRRIFDSEAEIREGRSPASPASRARATGASMASTTLSAPAICGNVSYRRLGRDTAAPPSPQSSRHTSPFRSSRSRRVASRSSSRSASSPAASSPSASPGVRAPRPALTAACSDP